MTSKTVYLHIGFNKAGSTSIQSWLSLNSSELKRSGILYPAIGRLHDAHYEVSAALGVGPNIDVKQDTVDELKSTIARWKGESVVLSSEYFVHATGPAIERIRGVLSGHNVKIVAYVRRHDEWFESLYKQACKTVRQPPWGNSIQDYISYIERMRPVPVDYPIFIEQWAKVFGHGAIVVRPFNKSQFIGRSLITDFATVVELQERPDGGERPRNESLDCDSVYILNLLTFGGVHHQIVSKFVKYMESWPKQSPRRYFLSNSQRQEVYRKYRPQYATLCQQYKLGPVDEVFPRPEECDDAHVFNELRDFGAITRRMGELERQMRITDSTRNLIARRHNGELRPAEERVSHE